MARLTVRLLETPLDCGKRFEVGDIVSSDDAPIETLRGRVDAGTAELESEEEDEAEPLTWQEALGDWSLHAEGSAQRFDTLLDLADAAGADAVAEVLAAVERHAARSADLVRKVERVFGQDNDNGSGESLAVQGDALNPDTPREGVSGASGAGSEGPAPAVDPARQGTTVEQSAPPSGGKPKRGRAAAG